MNDNTAQRIFFALLLTAVSAAFIWLVRGFVQPIFWAVALAIVFFPLHARFRALLKGRESIAAAATVLTILLIVVLPLGAIVTAMATEAANLVVRIQTNDIDVSGAIDWARQQLPLAERVVDTLRIDIEQLKSQLSSSALVVSQFLATQAVAIGQNTIRIAVYFFMMLYLLFFFMRDGTRIIDGLVRA